MPYTIRTSMGSATFRLPRDVVVCWFEKGGRFADEERRLARWYPDLERLHIVGTLMPNRTVYRVIVGSDRPRLYIGDSLRFYVVGRVARELCLASVSGQDLVRERPGTGLCFCGIGVGRFS